MACQSLGLVSPSSWTSAYIMEPATSFSQGWRSPSSKPSSTNVEAIFNAKGLIPMKDVLKVAGQLAWAGGIFPWIRGFNACLWAAITDHVASTSASSSAKKQKVSMKKRPTHLMFVKRISQSIAWTRLLLSGLIRDQGGTPIVVARWLSVAHRLDALQVCIRTDASPYGMGAILFKKGLPVLWMALDWSLDDLAFL